MLISGSLFLALFFLMTIDISMANVEQNRDMEELESKLKTEFSERESQLMETIESNTRSFEEQKKQLTKKVSHISHQF